MSRIFWQTYTSPLAPLFFQRHRDLARVSAFGADRDFAGSALLDALELVAPLYKNQCVRGQQFLKTEGFQLPLRFETIDIDVEQLDRLAVVDAVVLVNQRERGTGDLVRLGGIERVRDVLDQRGFPSAKVAAQQQQL